MGEFEIHNELRTHLVDFELDQFSPTCEFEIDLELAQFSNSTIVIDFDPRDISK